MNKKVVTFLSLFSLVLILSIYYVYTPLSLRWGDKGR